MTAKTATGDVGGFAGWWRRERYPAGPWHYCRPESSRMVGGRMEVHSRSLCRRSVVGHFSPLSAYRRDLTPTCEICLDRLLGRAR